MPVYKKRCVYNSVCWIKVPTGMRERTVCLPECAVSMQERVKAHPACQHWKEYNSSNSFEKKTKKLKSLVNPSKETPHKFFSKLFAL